MASYTTVDDVCARFPSFVRGGKITDDEITAWISETADLIEATALARGYDVASAPDDAATLLTAMNKLAAQIRLGEAIWAQAGATGEWRLLESIREEYYGKDGKSGLLGCFRKGDFDKLFLGSLAKTEDPGPQLGGFVPGAQSEPDNVYSANPVNSNTIFRRDQKL